MFAVVHRLGVDTACEAGVIPSFLNHEMREHADSLARGIDSAFDGSGHHASRTASAYKCQAGSSDQFTHSTGHA